MQRSPREGEWYDPEKYTSQIQLLIGTAQELSGNNRRNYKISDLAPI